MEFERRAELALVLIAFFSLLVDQKKKKQEKEINFILNKETANATGL